MTLKAISYSFTAKVIGKRPIYGIPWLRLGLTLNSISNSFSDIPSKVKIIIINIKGVRGRPGSTLVLKYWSKLISSLCSSTCT